MPCSTIGDIQRFEEHIPHSILNIETICYIPLIGCDDGVNLVTFNIATFQDFIHRSFLKWKQNVLGLALLLSSGKNTYFLGSTGFVIYLRSEAESAPPSAKLCIIIL
jgi:hypothetical protein